MFHTFSRTLRTLPRQIEVQEMKHWEIKICASLFLLLLSYSLIHCFILEVEKNTRRVPNGEKSLRGIENRTLKIESNFLPFPIGPRRNFSSSCHLFGTYPLLFEECLYGHLGNGNPRMLFPIFERAKVALPQFLVFVKIYPLAYLGRHKMKEVKFRPNEYNHS